MDPLENQPIQPGIYGKLEKRAKISLVLGVIGMIAWLLPIVGFPITIVGLVFSVKGMKSAKHGLAVAGLTLSIIGLFLTTVNASIGAYTGATGQNHFINKILGRNDQSQAILQNNNDTPKAELIDKMVQEAKKSLSLPYKADQITTLVDITAEPDAIRYHYVLSGVDTNKITNDLLKNNISPNICKNKQTRYILDQDINMEYSYSVENSTQKYFISFTKTDCK